MGITIPKLLELITIGVLMMAPMYLPLPLDIRLLAPLFLIAASVVQFWAGGV